MAKMQSRYGNPANYNVTPDTNDQGVLVVHANS